MAKNQGEPKKPDAGKDLIKETKARIEAEKEFGSSIQYAQKALMEQVKALKQQQGLVQGLVRSSQLLNNATKQNADLKNDLSSLYRDELQTANDVILKRGMVYTQLQGEYAQYLAQYMIQKKIKDVSDPRLENIIKELKHRQELNKKLGDERDLHEEVAEKTLEIREEAESYKKSLDKVLATARAIGNDPKTMGAFMLTQSIEKLEVFTQGFEDLRNEGLSAGQAIEGKFKGLSMSSLLGLSDTSGALKGFTEAYGSIGGISDEVVDSVGKMAHHFGISGQEAAKLNASLSMIPGETSESAAHAMEMTGHMAEMQGIAPGKIMKDMAANTGEMARAGSKGAEEFGKSVVALHKMGVEMSTASKIADGLLDFESSINAQMEASTLLGKEINLDKARELALNNDLEGMTKEIANNIGGAAEFGKMNRLQQDALAKSVGMSTEELAKMMDHQEESNKYFGEGASAMDNITGKALEYGSAVGGFLKENGMAMLSIVQFMSSADTLRMAGWAKEKIIHAWRMMTGKAEMAQAKLKKDGTLDMRFKKNKIPKDLGSKAADKLKGKGGDLVSSAGGGADKMSKVKPSTPGVGKGLKDIAGGVGAFGSGKVILGALIGLPASAIGLVTMVAGIPALAAASMLGVPAGKGLKGIASGVGAFGDGKVAVGALVVGLTGIGLGLMVAGVPALIIAAILGIPAGIGLKAIAEGVEAFGKGKVAMAALLIAAVAGGMLLLGEAAMLFAAGGAAGTAMMIISLIALVAAIAILGALGMGGVGFIGVALVLALGIAMLLLGAAVMLAGIGISMVVDAFTRMFAVVSMENIGALLMLGPALYLIAAGMVVFAVGLLIAAPAMLLFGVAAFLASYGVAALGLSFMLLGAGIIIASVGLLLMNVAVQQLAENAPLVSGHLVTMASTASGLLLVAGAVWAISAGLGMMALAGLAVLPIIGGLILLAAVAPALVALGGALGDLLGGGGGDEKDDKMDELIGEVRGLKAIMSQGGVINMDGRKVGDVLRLGMTSSGVK